MSSIDGALDVAYAEGVVATLGFFMHLNTADAYDRIFEESRHSLLYLDTALSSVGRERLRPLLDTPTALQVEAWAPGTYPRPFTLFGKSSSRDARTRAVDGLCCRSCSPFQACSTMAQQLWERLPATGLQDVATAFFDHGVRSLDDAERDSSHRGRWERVPFPIKVETVRCIGASLKAGGYHSCSALYFGAVVGHQIRSTGIPVGEDVRWAIRDTVRAMKRGLGPAQLKDSFDVEHLSKISPYTRERIEFHVGQLDPEVVDASRD